MRSEFVKLDLVDATPFSVIDVLQKVGFTGTQHKA